MPNTAKPLQPKERDGSSPGFFQQQVMAAIDNLKSLAYGLQIRRELSEKLERDCNQAQVYAALLALRDRNLVSFTIGSTLDFGLRQVKIYSLTDEGRKALKPLPPNTTANQKSREKSAETTQESKKKRVNSGRMHPR